MVSANVKACSETYGAPYPGVLDTVIPNSDAAARSTWSTPVPQTDSIFNLLQWLKTSRSNCTDALIFTMASASRIRSMVSELFNGRSKCQFTSDANHLARGSYNVPDKTGGSSSGTTSKSNGFFSVIFTLSITYVFTID